MPPKYNIAPIKRQMPQPTPKTARSRHRPRSLPQTLRPPNRRSCLRKPEPTLRSFSPYPHRRIIPIQPTDSDPFTPQFRRKQSYIPLHSHCRAIPLPDTPPPLPRSSGQSPNPATPSILSYPFHSPLKRSAPLPQQRGRGAPFPNHRVSAACFPPAYQTIRFQQLPPALHVRLRLLPPRATSSTSSVTRTQ